ncbi:MAG: sugar ABC transporter ATP-binding protein [Microbacteriaceae bacterium]|nr:sugar ABC transporter ATP-binding protein [Microbacteriaceae bacterium]
MTSSLTLTGISHDYGDGPVLREVNLAVTAGRVHALLGMNGAGKSTLVHLAAGFFPPTSGEIRLDGEPVTFANPADALRRGVALLAQEVDRALVPDATVHENLLAATLRSERRTLFSAKKNAARAREILGRYGVDLDPNRRVDQLSLYEKQVLLLVRAAAGNARYLFLDEPTSAFDAAETERFYGIVETLTDEGIGIVFISHRLGEVFRIADEVSVLRGGRVSLHKPIADTSTDEVVAAITGEVTTAQRTARAASTAAPVLRATALDLGRGRTPFNLTVGEGEIVAVYGPLGSGKTTLARTLFGLHRPYRAEFSGESRTISSAIDARKTGLALVPEERRTQGIWLDESVQTHFAIGFRGIIRSRRERTHADEVIARYDVQPPRADQLLRRMSGGNQQKVAIAKWASVDGRTVLILDEPMKGVDVAAKEAIFRSIEQLAAEGAGVLYLTQEPDDALRIADRVIVLGRDGVDLERPAAELTPIDLMFTERSEVE